MGSNPTPSADALDVERPPRSWQAFLVQLDFICRAEDERVRSLARVRELAISLQHAWSAAGVEHAIEREHVHGAQSEVLNSVFGVELRERGFASERKGLFAQYEVPGLRPDWYLPLEDGDGIIAEVERGGVLTNNRDLLDFYKCHICREASHLFLVAPVRIHGRGSAAVVKRMRALFGENVRGSVRSVAVFGYGT